MNKQHLAIIFLLVFVPYFFYALRPDIIGADGYLYLLHICHKDSFVLNNPINQNPLVAFIYSFIPCNILAVKFILFGLAFVSALLLYKIAELYLQQDAVWAVLFAFGFSQLFFFTTVYFEPQQFAIPFLFASLYFYLKGKQKGNTIGTNYKIVGLGWLLPAGMIWKGSVLLLFAYGITFLPALLLSVIVLLWQGANQLVVFLPVFPVQENLPVVGFASLAFLLIGYKYLNNFKWEIIFLSAFALLNSKFAFVLVPFLAVGATQFVQSLNKNQRTFVLSFALVLFLFTIPRIFMAVPTIDDWEATNFAIAATKDNNTILQNDWDYGYWIAWVGMIPSSYGGGDFNNLKQEGILFSQFNQPGCLLLKKFGTKSVWKC